MELPKWDMKGPLISAQMTHGVSVQAKSFSDPYACGTHQEKGVCEEVVSLSKLMVEKFIDFRRKGFGKISITGWQVL